MKNEEIAKRLNGRAIKFRCLWGALTLAFFSLAIAFTTLCQNSKAVAETGIPGVQTTTYNPDYITGVIVGWVGAFWCTLLFLFSVIFLRTKAISVGNDEIMVYSGFIKNELYVNGEFCDKIATRFNKGYLEGKLSDGSKVTASVSWHGYHLSFSGGHEAIDL